MGKSKIFAAILAASMAYSSTASAAIFASPGPTFGTGNVGFVWAIFGCSSGIIFTALVKSRLQNKELTWNEAASCGALYWLTPQKKEVEIIGVVPTLLSLCGPPQLAASFFSSASQRA